MAQRAETIYLSRQAARAGQAMDILWLAVIGLVYIMGNLSIKDERR
jgi:hypothetical protein